MKYEESKYIGFDGTRMFMAVYRPDDDKPRALVILLHGFGSLAGDFVSVGEYLANHGMTAFIPDLRGFGHYSGLKGHVMSFDEYIEDIQNLVMQAKDRYLNKITYLFGSSLGAINAVRYVIRYPRTVDGLILQSPAMGQKLDIGIGKKIAGNFLSILNVKRYFTTGVDYADMCRNQDTVKRHETDPLRFDSGTARFGVEALKAAKDALESAPRIIMPVLLQQAGDDKVVNHETNHKFFDNLASADKTWKLYDGLYHEIHEEPERDQVLGDLYSWLDTRLPS